MNGLVTFPQSKGSDQAAVELVCDRSIVVVGANGSGKTRLGVWLETTGPQKNIVHRIPAQRNIRLPPSTSPKGMQEAMDDFQWGQRPPNWDNDTWERNKHARKLQDRYGNVDVNSVATASLSDFDKLLVFIFSENYSQLLDFKQRYEKSFERIDAPETILEKVSRVWKSILIHRSLVLGSGEIKAQPLDESDPYIASGMSDGERAVFYLVGQCLCAPPASIIVVDEPELHLHRSIQRRLWDTLESERGDCQFIYITHDIDFAETRVGATKVWLRSADGHGFDWRQIEASGGLPEAVYMEILGSRRPVIFTEGVAGKIDFDVYKAVYPEYLVKPMESCSDVISATKSFSKSAEFHHIRCYGIVDRDYLNDDQILSYRGFNVWTPLVAEVENLFLVKDFLQVMARKLAAGEAAVGQVVEMVFSEFNRLKQSHALALTQRDVVLSLGRFDGADGVLNMSKKLADTIGGIDVEKIYSAYVREVDLILERQDYSAILRVFNHKGLVGRVTGIFGLTKPSYKERARQLLKNGDADLIGILKRWLPDFDGR
ncbi:AAA family ATPase [Xanthomonas campestris pv. cannae]|nr:AAA family ATPase [Xanthomonas campestris pv. cannae]